MRERAGLRLLCSPRWGRDRASGYYGPTAAAGEGSSSGMGCLFGRISQMSRAVALLCVDLTQSSEAGTVRELCWHDLPRERKGVWGGKDRARPVDQGHWVVRSQWALIPTEGKGSRKGQGEVWRGQQALPASDSNPHKASCQTPHPPSDPPPHRLPLKSPPIFVAGSI